MKLRRLWAISRKEFLHVIRDPRSLGMAIAIPMLMLFLYGYALTLDVDRVPTVVWDQSETALSRKLVASFDGSPYFTVVDYVNGYDEIRAARSTRAGRWWDWSSAGISPNGCRRDAMHPCR